MLRRFTAAEITAIRTMAARGATANEVGIALDRDPLAIRAKACALGVSFRPPKRVWHRLRILIEPLLCKAIVLAARRRGMRAGELVRRLLTAIMCYDLVDPILDKAASRKIKIGAIAAQIKHAPVTPLMLTLQPQLYGSMGDVRIDAGP